MVKINNYEGKNLEEAKNKAYTDLNSSSNELFIKEEFIEGKLFKSSKYKIEVIEHTTVKNYILEFFKNLEKLMNISIESEIRFYEDSINIILITNKNSILIGKEGRTLDSIQTLMRQIIKNQTNMNLKVNIDISNYKAKKLQNLEYQIKKIAKEVQNSHIDAHLDPMNSYERRTIHTLITEMPNLETESIGEGKERHIVIKYVEK